MSKHKRTPVFPEPPRPTDKEIERMICRNCGHHDGHFCRRYPPTVFMTPAGEASLRWPPVPADEWCGEYKKPHG